MRQPDLSQSYLQTSPVWTMPQSTAASVVGLGAFIRVPLQPTMVSWYHGSCYVNADRIVCQVLLFLIGTNTQCIEWSLLLYCIKSTVYLMYSIHKQMFVTTNTFYVNYVRTLPPMFYTDD